MKTGLSNGGMSIEYIFMPIFSVLCLVIFYIMAVNCNRYKEPKVLHKYVEISLHV